MNTGFSSLMFKIFCFTRSLTIKPYPISSKWGKPCGVGVLGLFNANSNQSFSKIILNIIKSIHKRFTYNSSD